MVTKDGRMIVLNPNRSIVDRVQIGNDDAFIDVSEEQSVANWPLGTRLQIGDRVYRYTQNGAVALATAVLVQAPVIEANGDVTDMAVDTPAIGALQMEVTNGGNTAITLNEFAEGWLHVNDDTGEGYAYQIRANDAIATSGSGTIFLYDAVKVALVANATVSLTHSPYFNNIIHPSPPTARLTGVAPGVITADFHFWAQTWGPGTVLQDGTLYEGQDVMASVAVDGACESFKIRLRTGSTGAADVSVFVALEDSDGSEVAAEVGTIAVDTTNDITGPTTTRPQQKVGVSMHPNITAEHTLIYLMIAP